MKLLLDSHNLIIDNASDIVVGIYDEPFEKYALLDEKGEIKAYALLDSFHVGETDSLPADYILGKYIYVDGKVVENPDYVEPPTPVEEVVEELTETTEETQEIVDTVLSELLPAHSTSISELEDIVDYLLTEILPNRV